MSGARRIAGAHDAGATLTFLVDGEPVMACPGETIATALLAAGRRELRSSTRRGEPRGLYCVMGVCWECAVRVNGRSVRACVTPATAGLRVETLGARERAGS